MIHNYIKCRVQAQNNLCCAERACLENNPIIKLNTFNTVRAIISIMRHERELLVADTSLNRYVMLIMRIIMN